MIPKEVREFIIKLVDDKVKQLKTNLNEKFKDVAVTTEELNEQIDALKVDIQILKDGGNF